MNNNMYIIRLRRLYNLKCKLHEIQSRINEHKKQIKLSQLCTISNVDTRLSQDVTDEQIKDLNNEAVELYYFKQKDIYDTALENNQTKLEEIRARCVQMIIKANNKKGAYKNEC